MFAKNIDLKISQLTKEKAELTEKVSTQEKTISQSNGEIKALKDEKSKLLQDIREKDLKIDELESKIKELNKRIAH